jgi:cytochrome c peroxidase
VRPFVALLVLTAGILLLGIRPSPSGPPRAGPRRTTAAYALIHSTYLRHRDSLDAAVSELARLPTASDPETARMIFRRARVAYKRIEYLVGYQVPDAVIALDGAPLPRIDEHMVDGVLPPTGLQVIEGALFPAPMPGFRAVLRAQAERMRPALDRLRSERQDTIGIDPRIFDAMRQEIARVTTLGLAGFDAGLSGDGIRESAEALRGVREGNAAYRPAPGDGALGAWRALDRRLAAAVAALEAKPDFDRFDRLGFIVGYANPASAALSDLQRALGIPQVGRNRSWSVQASNIYQPGAMVPDFYAPSDAPPLRSDLIGLGAALFNDPALSARRTRACATCHQPGRAFTDGRVRAAVDPGTGVVRNTPTLLNASLQPFQFADQRAQSLEDQIALVLENPREMGLSLGGATARLRGDPGTVTRFAQAFGGPPAGAVTERRVQLALAAYVRSLAALRSRFDRAVQGDTAALTPPERRGLNLFMGKAACATCHFPPLFGGTLPPANLEAEPEVIGVPANAVSKGATVDPDPGVYGYDHASLHRHAFKTPGLRNVALTPPYMHNGVYRTLIEVVDFYDRGGGAGIGIDLPNLTLPSDSLHLSRREKQDLVAFLGSLTDTTYAAAAESEPGRARPDELPRAHHMLSGRSALSHHQPDDVAPTQARVGQMDRTSSVDSGQQLLIEGIDLSRRAPFRSVPNAN